MGLEELSEFEKKVFDYCTQHDFEADKWDTAKAAEDLGMEKKAVYEALCNLQKHMKGRFYIYYKNGGLRVQAE